MNLLLDIPLQTVFGWLASVFTTLILVPQLYKVIRTRHTRDVSMSMLVLSVIGNGFWVLQATITGNTPLQVGASLICLMSMALIVFKFLFDANN